MSPTTIIKVNSKELFDALQTVSRVTPSPSECEKRCLKPIYSCIVFRMNDYFCIEVMSSNYKILAHKTVSLTDRKGDTRQFAILEWDIVPIVRRLDDQELTIELYEYQATFRHSYGSFTVPFVKEDIEEIFELHKEKESIQDTHSLEVEAPFFRSMISRLCRYAAQDELRPALAGINIKRRGGKVEYTASDGHRLMRIAKTDTECTFESNLILPLNMIKILRRITPRTGFITISYTEWKEDSRKTPTCHITIDGTTQLWFTPVEGKYPNYDAVIPKNCKWKFKIQRTVFSKSLDRMSLFCPASNIIKFCSYKNKITLSAKDKDFNIQASETLPVEHETKSFNIRFGVRVKNMQEILSSLKGKEIYIQGNKCDQAMIITSVSQAEGEEVTTIFMPCSISDDDETEENP